MHSFIVNIQRRLQQQTVAMWLFAVAYAMSASYANSHVHDIPHGYANSFNQKLDQFVQSLHLDEPTGHWDANIHECSACKYQFNPLIPSASGTVASLRANIEVREPLVQLVSISTPTKRLTRAPPIV